MAPFGAEWGAEDTHFSPLEGLFVVRARHAHAWARACVDGAWQELDTTPSTWLAAERGQASALQPLLDLFSLALHREVRRPLHAPAHGLLERRRQRARLLLEAQAHRPRSPSRSSDRAASASNPAADGTPGPHSKWRARAVHGSRSPLLHGSRARQHREPSRGQDPCPGGIEQRPVARARPPQSGRACCAGIARARRWARQRSPPARSTRPRHAHHTRQRCATRR